MTTTPPPPVLTPRRPCLPARGTTRRLDDHHHIAGILAALDDRALASHVATARGLHPSFPLLHHARVLIRGPRATEAVDGLDAIVAYWGGDPAVRARLDAPARAMC